VSLRAEEPAQVPEATVRVARAVFRKGNIYIRLRDELGVIFKDEDFQELYPKRGQPTEPPWRLAMITLMQFAEDLTDRQAADAVRARIDWKYALSLELDDPGFDYSVLSEFRSRLIEGGAESKLFDVLLERCRELGLVKAGGQQRTDSTHVLAVIRTLNRLELLRETVRAALNALAVAAPEWLQGVAPVEWYERYSERTEDSRLPKKPQEREVLAEMIGKDGMRLLDVVYEPQTPVWLREVPAVHTMLRSRLKTGCGCVPWRIQHLLARGFTRPTTHKLTTVPSASSAGWDTRCTRRKRVRRRVLIYSQMS
jgi:transposase